ncbi:shikimate dehydrogenase [Candidatus Woesearchaeota archaeon]|nr:shikimate dehydrogenase [Candidatus Woesearchaeota archaeon]
MIAAVITERDEKDALNAIKKIKDADLIELRLDYIKNLDDKKLKNLIKNCRKPVIATCRKKSEGGFFSGSENERINILKNAVKLGADYVDIEYSSDKNVIKDIIKNKTKAIVSCHDFKQTPSNLGDIYNNIKKLNPDLIKIVTYANSVTDNFKIFDLIKTANEENKKIIAFCMGSYGQFSRILSAILGSQITYSSIEEGKESADCQLTMNEMVNYYRIKKLNKNTKVVGLIGNPVEHSWSHIIHNSAFDKLNINAVYLKFQVDKLKKFIEYMKPLNLIGFSVTIPHKVEIMMYIDGLDKQAKGIGAVNTLVVKNGKLIGYNTDCPGAIRALKQKTELKNKNAVVLGAGGAARAMVYGLIENKSNVTILNRTVEKAKLLADYFKCDYGSLDDLKDIDYDILINTTSVGMYPKANELPIGKNSIKNNKIVFDMVFNPFKTKLLVEAEKRNCTIINGFEMLIYGALLQFKLWTGKDAPEQLMRQKVMEFLKNASH